jgi:uncharacterized protein
MSEGYFFDSYAIIEIINGNENYRFVANSNIITSTMNLAEVYYALLIGKNKETAELVLEKFDFEFLDVTSEIAIDSALFRYKHKKQKLSYIDCVGYILSKKNGLAFLTGDKEFEKIDGVKFVK